MCEKKLAAVEGTVGAKNFDLYFLEVGASDGNVVALELDDNLPLRHGLTGKDVKAKDSAAKRRIDVNNVRGIGGDVRRNVEIVGALRRMDDGGFDIDVDGLAFKWRSLFAGRRRNNRKCDGEQYFDVCLHGSMSVAVA